MPSETSSKNLKQDSQHLKNNLQHRLPPLENVSLSMPLSMNTNQPEEKTTHPESDTGILEDLVTEHIRTPKFKKFERQTLENIQKIGALLAPFSLMDSITIVTMAEARAKEITDYAEVDPKFFNALNNMYSASPLISMITGLGYLGLALMSNHGINPIENMIKKRLEKNGKDTIQPLSPNLQA